MKKLNLIAAATVLTASTSAYADPVLIEQWSFINEAGFSNWTTVGSGTNSLEASGDSSDGGTSILSTGALPDNLCWGDPVNANNDQSCLSINSPVSNETTQSWDEDGMMVDINGGAPQGNAMTVAIGGDYTTAFKQGTAVRHNNFPITGEMLDTVSIRDGLRLEAVAPEGVVVNAPELEFMVDFWETPNGGLDADGTCPFGPPSRTPGSVNENGCSDIFKIVGFDGAGDLNIVDSGEGFIDFSVKFTVTGVDASEYHRNYELITRLSGLDVTFDDEGVGFVTRENGVNILNAQFAVRAIDAPEPSTLAVFAVSLLGLAGFSRRKFK
ncbi:PEP-CTERM sorting domain-containing protein [Alteromonas ponticola]|uniref:PEP-CTERM sorting domain-containing protein n=1 Tax=Alteromonas aquimaris TaxID=2998417 RepID=A0ABT3P3D1_9ALTE|nr:THxN family PEP-CTERM protein [Alteromonas aquimaris]MCW8107274.1 PEP-CTERM sorting domain-containing protein [Alteromonas aquimaris]